MVQYSAKDNAFHHVTALVTWEAWTTIPGQSSSRIVKDGKKAEEDWFSCFNEIGLFCVTYAKCKLIICFNQVMRLALLIPQGLRGEKLNYKTRWASDKMVAMDDF